MSDFAQVPADSLASLSTGAREVIHHLCESDCRGFGDVLQWCETRDDCTYAIVCPGCATQFLLDEDELTGLERWSRTYGPVHVCGLRESA